MPPALDLAGKAFGRLTAVKRVGRDRYDSVLWECLCQCGNAATVRASHLSHGQINSCGCLRNETTKERSQTHGMSRTSTYKIWRGMVDRCTNSNSPVWRHYGGRGIVVCERWMHSFTNFFEDMGERPPGLTLDRKNNNAGYYKANCRWIDQRAQSRNKRDNRLLKFRGETKTLMEWQEITGIGRGTIKRRILNGWTVEDALSTPVHSRPEGKPLRHPSRLLDLTGKTFERLTVLERSPTQRNSNSPEWICQCMCGNTVTVIGHLLKSGQTQSCGCLRRGRLIARNTSKRAD